MSETDIHIENIRNTHLRRIKKYKIVASCIFILMFTFLSLSGFFLYLFNMNNEKDKTKQAKEGDDMEATYFMALLITIGCSVMFTVLFVLCLIKIKNIKKSIEDNNYQLML